MARKRRRTVRLVQHWLAGTVDSGDTSMSPECAVQELESRVRRLRELSGRYTTVRVSPDVAARLGEGSPFADRVGGDFVATER